MNNFKFSVLLPLLLAAFLGLGIFIGSKLTMRQTSMARVQSTGNGKIESLLRYINMRYVDSVNQTQLEDKALNSLLQNLDPHSTYVNAKDAKAMNEPLKGNFGGIGVEFNILKDTIRVVSAISGGPSEALGILPGDMIVKVEGKSVAGVKITNQQVFSKLRGDKGTKVNIEIKRNGHKALLPFTITRGEIPIYSVDIAYMVTPKVGYIKISRFGATTYDEYLVGFHKLKDQGMQNLILDLRGNPGGFLNAAVAIADEFLPDGKEIVHTQGRAEPRKVHKATSRGEFEKNKLVLLIDEGSASASEIVAGAVQDNDRAIIVGRRSFGKGLVQEEKEFSDSSAVRLTIARYYTPTGRCIQKSYKEGLEAYYSEESDRFTKGELENADSIKFNTKEKFKTPAGKVVYGGGGIMPDVFVPLDTTGHSVYLGELVYSGSINQFAFYYADHHRDELKKMQNPGNFDKNFNITDQILQQFVDFAAKSGVKPREKDLQRSKKLITVQLKALIARDIWNNAGYFPIILSEDPTFKKALDLAK